MTSASSRASLGTGAGQGGEERRGEERLQGGAMEGAMMQARALHAGLGTSHGRGRRGIGAAPLMMSLRAVVCASGGKGFGGQGSNEAKKKVRRQGGGSGEQSEVRRGDDKRAVAVRQGSKQLQNVLRSVDKVSASPSGF